MTAQFVPDKFLAQSGSDLRPDVFIAKAREYAMSSLTFRDAPPTFGVFHDEDALRPNDVMCIWRGGRRFV